MVGNPLIGGSVGSFGISESKKTGRQKKSKQKKTPQNTCLTEIASGEVAQRLVLATSKQGLGRETQAA